MLNVWSERKVNTDREKQTGEGLSLSHDTTCHCQPVYKIGTFYVVQL